MSEPHAINPNYAAGAEEYSHTPYLTRTITRSTIENDDVNAYSRILGSYTPHRDQLYSLLFETSYYDIPGRAPRCKFEKKIFFIDIFKFC